MTRPPLLARRCSPAPNILIWQGIGIGTERLSIALAPDEAIELGSAEAAPRNPSSADEPCITLSDGWAASVSSHVLRAYDVSYLFPPSEQLVQPMSSMVSITEQRGEGEFTEQMRLLQLHAPHGGRDGVNAVAVSVSASAGAENFHVLTRQPAALFSFPGAAAAGAPTLFLLTAPSHTFRLSSCVRHPLRAETNETSSDPSCDLMASMLPLDHLLGSLPVGLCPAEAWGGAGTTGAADEVILHCLDGGVLYRLHPGAVGAGTGIAAASIIELPEAFHGGKVNRMPWMNAFTNRMRRERPPVQMVQGAAGTLICFRSGEPSVLIVQLEPPRAHTQEGQRAASAISGATAHLITLPEELLSQGAVVVGARALQPPCPDTAVADSPVRFGDSRGERGASFAAC